MWRLAVGNETPKIFNPKVAVIFIGINDLRDRTPPEEVKERMEYVIQWMLKNMPDSKIVLQALLPSLSKVDETNENFEKLATDYNIVYSDCGTDIKKADRSTYMADRLHPNVNGQNLWLKCLRNVVQPLLDES
jgi:lysophospholipase L1-like esterase